MRSGLRGIDRQRRPPEGKNPPERAVRRVVLRYTDGRELIFEPEHNWPTRERPLLSSDDLTEIADTLAGASAVLEWGASEEGSAEGRRQRGA